MTEVNNKCLIGNGDFFPILHIKIDKSDTFLYCVALYILLDGISVEICRCDNSHNKGNHIHYHKPNCEGEETPFDFKGIGNTIDYFQSNWKNLMEKYKNG